MIIIKHILFLLFPYNYNYENDKYENKIMIGFTSFSMNNIPTFFFICVIIIIIQHKVDPKAVLKFYPNFEKTRFMLLF